MNNNLLSLISDLFQSEITTTPEKNSYVSTKSYDPSKNELYEFRYYADIEPEKIRIEKIYKKRKTSKTITFREFLWNQLGLDSIQEVYSEQYQKWKEWNQNIDYVPVRITCDSAPEEEPRKSDEFFHSFCRQEESDERLNGLSLVMAEYGMGKSSFCINLCKMATADRKLEGKVDRSGTNSLKKAFCDGSFAFPLFFSLNTYKNGDFDEYIENRLHNDYSISFRFLTLVNYCCAGYFCIVLDAWDQMHHTPYASQVQIDFNCIRRLCEGRGRVLITCRRSFYQKYLKLKHESDQGIAFKAIQAAALFTLGGFDKESVSRYLLEALPNNESILSCINKALPNNESIKEKIDDWTKECWELNSEFLEKPFNVRILTSNFDVVLESMDLRKESIRTYRFLSVILNKWREDNGFSYYKGDDNDPLKELVFLTLSSGLNRGIDVDLFKSKLVYEKNAEEYLSAFRRLEFIDFNDEHYGNKTTTIEFRLAAFQEFLWASYVLEELSNKKQLDKRALINCYMLPLEVRAWITEELKNNTIDWLLIQLKGDGDNFSGLKYKDKTEIGYCASNVLTLYRDLNKVKYYHDQFRSIQKDLRHYCFEEADLRGLDLREAQFDYSDLYRVDLSYTNLEKASFKGADLSEVVWDEYGRIEKCAFIENYSPITKTWDIISIAAGTEVGSLLTYAIPTEYISIMNIEDSTINAIAADAEGVYTASRNGWVGYIDAKTGELKNAFIAKNGLESIATVGRASVYVGAEAKGLVRYNWRTGVKQAIEIDGYVKEIKTVNYREIDGVGYIACIYGYNKKELLLLKLSGGKSASVVMRAQLKNAGYYFDDISFAGNELAYVISGIGVYSIVVKDLIVMEELDDKELCKKKYLRFKCRGRSVLAWAEDAKALFVLEKEGNGIKRITGIQWEEDYRTMSFGLEWNYNGKNYLMSADKADFCVSTNAKYVAISGDRLAVFERSEEDEYYDLIKEPVEALINVKGTDFKFCKGLSVKQSGTFNDRGAIV